MAEMTNDLIAETQQKINDGLYGPKFCKKCGKVQEIRVYEKAGSYKLETEKQDGFKYEMKASIMGSRHCSVCWQNVDET